MDDEVVNNINMVITRLEQQIQNQEALDTAYHEFTAALSNAGVTLDSRGSRRLSYVCTPIKSSRFVPIFWRENVLSCLGRGSSGVVARLFQDLSATEPR